MTQDGETQDYGTPENATSRDTNGGSLRDASPGHFRPTAEEFDRMWGEGMFVVDTNVLLNLYRYSSSTRDELLEVLRALKDKLFLPHQVGQEFLDRRLTTIRTQREKVLKLQERVTSVRGEMETELRKVLRLRTGEDLPKGLRDALEEVPPGGYEALSERLEALEKDLPRASNSPEDDEVWAAVEELVDGKVGLPYPDEEVREAEEEAERRRNAKIPPGFKDERPGDYVLLRQTIDEAKRSGKPVVLVTDDRKEDWWWIEQGETIGPHSALVAEMRKEAGVLFYMYTPDRLMVEARERLKVEVSDESISEAEGLGQETGDYATSEAGSWWRTFDDMYDTSHLLTDLERTALRAFFVQGRDVGGVAEDLGLSYVAASDLLELAIDKLEDVDIEIQQRRQSDPERKNVRRFVGRRNYPTQHMEPLVANLYVNLHGPENRIVSFTKTLLEKYPEIETIDRRPATDASGDARLELRFRPSVPADHAIRTVEDTARETRVVLLSLTYSHFEP